MKSERFILILVASLVGLLVAGGAFYLYQMTRSVSEIKPQLITKKPPTPTPNNAYFLVVDSPKDEEVVTNRTVTFSGKTAKDAIVSLNSQTDTQVIKPTAIGSFSTTLIINPGTNLVQITAIFPNGEEKRVLKTVTYSSENF